MHTEKVIYAQDSELPASEAPVFITATVIDRQRQLIIQESHVFLQQEGAYLHKINYINDSGHDFNAVMVGGIRDTHRLYANYMERSHAADPSHTFNRLGSFDADELDAHPFHRFRLENKFLREMWEIQEWTASRELRLALAQVTGYKTDHEEADLLSRIFSSRRSCATQDCVTFRMGTDRLIDRGLSF